MSTFVDSGGAAFSSKTSEWETPRSLFDRLDAVYHFTLDPCSTDKNAKCEKHYTVDDDGLEHDWTGETVFVNPPYGKEISRWVEKCHYESVHNNVTSVILLPARTDTAWFHEHIYNHANIEFLRGRVKFEIDGVPQGSAPFPSMIVVYD